MLDTITFRFDIELEQEYLLHWQRTVVHKANGACNMVFSLDITTENGTSIKCTYHPHSYKGQPLLLIEFSLPKPVSAMGELAGVYYFGLPKAKMEMPAEALENTMTSHPRSLQRRLRKILEAGVPLTMTESEEALPEMRIEGEEVMTM